MFYLRFTNTAQEDLERGTSLNMSSLKSTDYSKEDAASLFGCEEDDIDEVDGLWVQVLNGLCGYELEAETSEEAIEEFEDRQSEYQFKFVGKPVIFKGVYASDADYVADGDLFTPISIVKEF